MYQYSYHTFVLIIHDRQLRTLRVSVIILATLSMLIKLYLCALV